MLRKNEKRMFGRQRESLNVRISAESLSPNISAYRECVGQTIDLSGGGIYLKVADPLRVDDLVRLRFLPPNTFDFFSGMARVVRAKQNADSTFNVALEFVDVSDAEKKLLDYYLHRR